MNFAALLKTETRRNVKKIRSDNGGEYCSKEFQDWLAKNGIRRETTAPYTPQQNGVAERGNRTIMEATRSQMHAKKIPMELWNEAVSSSVYVLNRSLSSTIHVIPYETWYGEKPNIAYFRTLGSREFVHVPDSTRDKLDAKAQEVILVGYCNSSKAYRLWNPVTRRIIISRDVIFDEDSPFGGYNQKISKQDHTIHDPLQLSTDFLSNTQMKIGITNHPGTTATDTLENETMASNIPESSQTVTQPSETPNRRRSSRTSIFTNKYKKYRQSILSTDQEREFAMIAEPISYNEVIYSEEATLWKSAIKEECDSLIQNET